MKVEERRERLKKIVCGAVQEAKCGCPSSCAHDGGCGLCRVLVDHMIAHGVTVQEPSWKDAMLRTFLGVDGE